MTAKKAPAQRRNYVASVSVDELDIEFASSEKQALDYVLQNYGPEHLMSYCKTTKGKPVQFIVYELVPVGKYSYTPMWEKI